MVGQLAVASLCRASHEVIDESVGDSVHESVAVSCPTVAVTVGADGVGDGVAFASDPAPFPAGLNARTWNVYSVPLVSPVAVCEVADALVLTVSHACRFVTVGALPVDTAARTRSVCVPLGSADKPPVEKVCEVTDGQPEFAAVQQMPVHVLPSALYSHLVMLDVPDAVHDRVNVCPPPVLTTKSALLPLHCRSCHPET